MKLFVDTGSVSEVEELAAWGVLAASVRHPEHVVTTARLGCDVATVPRKVLRQMLGHPLTTAGIERFEADWRAQPELGEWLERVVAGETVGVAR